MSDSIRLPLDCNCGTPDCNLPDPDPSTDFDLPGDVRYGSDAWFKLMATIPVADPDEFLSEYDILAGDAPTWEDVEEYEAMTRGEPTAADLALAVAEIRRTEDQSNGYFAILDETPADETDRWFNRDVTEF